jgi:hypothetical protein
VSDKSKYLIFCIEAYKKARGLTGEEVYSLFDEYNFFDYINEMYELLHIQGTRYLLEELDEYKAVQDKQRRVRA